MKKVLFFWKELIATFWFLPVIIIGFSVALSIGLLTLDSKVTISQEGWIRFFLVNNSDSARSILSTISGAMIGVAGTVFSVTLVALTLASSQLGPRLIQNFMYIRLNQVVLGSYISTYLYCLLVLNAVSEDNEFTFIPSISILAAILAAITNIILLIVFIHQIAINIQADKVISDISDIISKQVKALFPQKMGEEKEEEVKVKRALAISDYQNHIIIKSPYKSGYIQYIDSNVLIEIVAGRNALLELNHRPGQYVVRGAELGILHSNADLKKDALDKLSNQFVIGKTKTSQQDLEFSIHQMVEIGSRALSTGVNDPFTTITCIDNLTATMSHLAQVEFPSKYRFDDEGSLRVIANTLNFEGVLDAAFNQIRQFSGGSPAVIIRLMESLTTILKFTSKESHKNAIIRHAEMVLRIGRETIKEKNDIEDLTKRAGKILK
ncbi:MAG: DUF2254 domain-containing protein [Balneolales bacterium]